MKRAPPQTFDAFCREAVDFLVRAKAPYLIIGGLAVGAVGEPRMTGDVDVIGYLRSWSAPCASRGMLGMSSVAWRELDPAGQIEDPALEVPLAIMAMIHAAKADDAVQRALIAKGNPVLEAHVATQRVEAQAEGVLRGKAEGVLRGKAEALLAVLAARGIAVGDAERARILEERYAGQLDHWLAGAAFCAEAAELFTMPGGR